MLPKWLRQTIDWRTGEKGGILWILRDATRFFGAKGMFLLRNFDVQRVLRLLHCLHQKQPTARTCRRCAPGRFVNKGKQMYPPRSGLHLKRAGRRVNLRRPV